jgi:hypothetical protein
MSVITTTTYEYLSFVNTNFQDKAIQGHDMFHKIGKMAHQVHRLSCFYLVNFNQIYANRTIIIVPIIVTFLFKDMMGMLFYKGRSSIMGTNPALDKAMETKFALSNVFKWSSTAYVFSLRFLSIGTNFVERIVLTSFFALSIDCNRITTAYIMMLSVYLFTTFL